jgi:hypothetical protein
MTDLEILLFILVAAWALGKVIEFIQSLKPERPRPEPLLVPQLPKATKIELFGGIPNKQVQAGPDSRCEICEAGFGSQKAFHSGMANDSRLVCSTCRDLMISAIRHSHAQNSHNADAPR